MLFNIRSNVINTWVCACVFVCVCVHLSVFVCVCVVCKSTQMIAWTTLIPITRLSFPSEYHRYSNHSTSITSRQLCLSRRYERSIMPLIIILARAVRRFRHAPVPWAWYCNWVYQCFVLVSSSACSASMNKKINKWFPVKINTDRIPSELKMSSYDVFRLSVVPWKWSYPSKISHALQNIPLNPIQYKWHSDPSRMARGTACIGRIFRESTKKPSPYLLNILGN